MRSLEEEEVRMKPSIVDLLQHEVVAEVDLEEEGAALNR